MEVFSKVVEPFIEVAISNLDSAHIHNFDIGSLIKKHSRRLLA
jgi:hypothetical protein